MGTTGQFHNWMSVQTRIVQDWKKDEEKRGQITKQTKEAFNLVSVWVKIGSNNQTKGKKNNFCIVYFEEVVVANVLCFMFSTLDVTHVERSSLNDVAWKNTDPRSMGTIGQFHNWMSVQTRIIHNWKKERRKERTNYKRDKKKLVSVWIKTGRNNQTKGKNNNFCIVYFEEVVGQTYFGTCFPLWTYPTSRDLRWSLQL